MFRIAGKFKSCHKWPSINFSCQSLLAVFHAGMGELLFSPPSFPLNEPQTNCPIMAGYFAISDLPCAYCADRLAGVPGWCRMGSLR